MRQFTFFKKKKKCNIHCFVCCSGDFNHAVFTSHGICDRKEIEKCTLCLTFAVRVLSNKLK